MSTGLLIVLALLSLPATVYVLTSGLRAISTQITEWRAFLSRTNYNAAQRLGWYAAGLLIGLRAPK